MDKFIVKRKKVEDGVLLNSSIEKEDDHVASTSFINKVAQKNKQPTPILVRKYLDSYLSFGFTFNGPENRPVPQCIVCGVKLSNESMVPSKLKRHLSSNHSHLLGKDKNYFSRLLSSEEKQAKAMVRRFSINERALLASYKVSEIVAKRIQPHTIAEDVILPACKEIVKSILGDDAEKEISFVPLSNDTVSRRIDDMSSDIQCHVREKLSDSRLFSLQLDESTDISKECQLLSYIRFIDEDSVIEQFLACSELSTTSTGADVYESMSNTLTENGLSWKNCLSVCTDGAPAITGKFKVFVAKVKQNFPNVGSIHCFIHREALIVKTIPTELKHVLNLVVNMVNFVKLRAFKTRLFKEMCREAGSKHDTLVLHTKIRWLSRGKVLQRFYEFKNELSRLFSAEKPNFAEYLNDTEWCAKLAYLADIFYHLNCLNESMQGKEENVLTSSDKLKGFLKKLEVWKRHVEKKSLKMFPLTFDIDPQGDITAQLVLNHLTALEDSMAQYFPHISVEKYDWVRNPYVTSSEPITYLSLEKEEQLAEIQEDRTLRLKYNELPLIRFWMYVKTEYPVIAEEAINILLHFSTTYLCELGFSALINLKNKKWERPLSIDQEMRVCLSSIRPRIEFLCTNRQTQVFHY
jgi:hypothetical protein